MIQYSCQFIVFFQKTGFVYTVFLSLTFSRIIFAFRFGFAVPQNVHTKIFSDEKKLPKFHFKMYISLHIRRFIVKSPYFLLFLFVSMLFRSGNSLNFASINRHMSFSTHMHARRQPQFRKRFL